jgi:hypothetical protein
MDKQLSLEGVDTNAQRCGRREPFNPNYTSPHRAPFGDEGVELCDTWRADGTCSYCGSVSQARFLKFVEDGGELTPTDKSYKVYLVSKLGRDGKMVEAPGLKFYFQHLDEHGQKEFVRLYNEKKMALGYPGHFYVRPYFCGVPV